jgi:hypothetical protein
MKKLNWLGALALASLMCLSTAARASDWGCKVLLCLSDPRGPETESACVPPIQALWRALAHGDPFPTCDLASGPNGPSFARPGVGFYNACPAGTTALASGLALQMRPADYSPTQPQAMSSMLVTGIGEGSADPPAQGETLGPKVCVSGEIGPVFIPSGTFDQDTGSSGTTATAYERVVIDVFVDGQLYTRVRY